MRLLKGCRPALALALALVAIGGCSRDAVTSLGEVVAPGSADGFNVLVVTIDTVRRDHLGCYGDPDAVTPTVDRLAAEGVLVDDAVASAPLTLPSHATLLTGLYPPRHGVHDNGLDALGPDVPTLAETLRDRGYATAAFVGAFVLEERFGLGRGFDVYDFEVSRKGYRPQMADFNERPADEVTDAALDWLRNRPADQPFFAWVHYFDPHLPYTSPLQARPDLRDRPYAAEIAYADHGESLGEHHEQTHGMFIYDATMRVPLVLWSPSLLPGPRRLTDRAVGLVDLPATILDLVGAPVDPAGDGLSLLGEIPADRRLYLETEGPVRMASCAALHGLRSTGEKLIEAPDPEFYDLAADPGELENLHHERRNTLAPWQSALAAVIAGGGERGDRRQISDEEATRLRSLGYTISSRQDDGGVQVDPKRRIREFNAGMEAERLYAEGDYAAAASQARRILAGCDGCLNAVRVLAFSQLRMGHPDSAVALLSDYVAERPDDFLLRSLAQVQIISGDHAGALETLDVYGTLAPDDGRVEVLRGDCRRALGDPEAAIRHYERAIAIDPHRSGIRARERIGETRGKHD